MNQEQIGKFIASCRKEKNITQREFAEKLGVTDKTVSRWENGHYLPDISLFNDICSILGIDVSELLKGEKIANIDKKGFDEITMNLVNISNSRIDKSRKKIILISSTIILLLTTIFTVTLIFTQKNKTKNTKIVPGTKAYFPEKIAIQEHDDGWVCYFRLSYLENDLKTPYYYGYGCDNFKYQKLYGYMQTGEEIDRYGNKFTYDANTNHPSYGYNDNYQSDIRKIDDFFSKKKFNKEIALNDLTDLDLKYLDKEDVLNLYNKAIKSEMNLKFGNYSNTNTESYLTTSMTKNDYTWYLGYILSNGNIKYVSIDVVIKDKYLSDLVKENKASSEENKLAQKISDIKDYIIRKQKFSLPTEITKQPYNFLDDNFDEIEKRKQGLR